MSCDNLCVHLGVNNMASDKTVGGVPLPMEVFETMDSTGDFDLLDFIDDSSLITTLGIEPTLVTEDCNTKLFDSNAGNYVDLLPPSPQQQIPGVTQVQNQGYYTIDTEPQVTNEGIDVLEETPLGSSDVSTLNHKLLSTATPPTQDEHITLTISDDNLDEFIILNTVDVQESHLSVVEVQEHPTSTTTRGKGLKRCNRKQLQPKVQIKESLPKTKPPRRRRPKKEKKYELQLEFEDPEQEKKRLNAINAKKNRDKKKDKLQELGDKVTAVTKERNELLKEVETLKQREQFLRTQLLSKYGVQLPNF